MQNTKILKFIKNSIAISIGGGVVTSIILLLILSFNFLQKGNEIFKRYDGVNQLDSSIFALFGFIFTSILFNISFLIITLNKQEPKFYLLSILSSLHFFLCYFVMFLFKNSTISNLEILLFFLIGILINTVAFKIINRDSHDL